MEKRRDQQTGTESKTVLVEQINLGLRSGDYPRALELLRVATAEFANDAELSELEKLAQDGVRRSAEANRLITESQEFFAQQKSAEAIQLLRKAHELDKSNSLARAILANALVEHAHSMVETDWWEAARLAKQALELNAAHPTAKTIRNLIRNRKETSSVEEWASQVHRLQSSGDLFAALSLVAEGLDVHSRNPKLLLLQDAIQRDQDARRRQARRGDLQALRRMESEVDGADDPAAKKALALRIQALAAKHWTDGEVISVANGFLRRLGLVPQESSSALPGSPRAPVIFHVPPPSAPESPRGDTSRIPPNPIPTKPVQPSSVPPASVAAAVVPPRRVPPRTVPPRKVLSAPQIPPPQAATVPAAEPTALAAKVTSPAPRPKQPTKSNTTTLILVSTAAMILLGAIFFLARKHHAPPLAKTAPAVAGSSPTAPAPVASAPAVSAPPQAAPEPSPPVLRSSSGTASGETTLDDQSPPEPGRNRGTLVVVAGQDGARVFLNGKLQRQLTQAGQLRLPNLELKDYVVQVSKTGFQDPSPQKIRIRKDEQARVIFNLQPQLRLASLIIQGGAPGTAVLVDQTLVGTVRPDGTLSVSTVNPGDHTVELRKERFKPRQFNEHFVGGGTISLAAADTVLEAAPGVLKITFTPADANVAIVKGDLLKMVTSGVPLNLAAGTYTLTARTADRLTRSSTLEVIAGQSKAVDLSLAPNGMSKWEDPGGWRHEGDSFTRKGGDFVLYGVVPASGTFVFSAMATKGRLLQWVLNYTDPKNYVLFQMDDNNFYRTVIRNGSKTDEIIVPHKGEKKSFRTLHIRVSPTEFVHQIKHGETWTVLDRWTQPGANLGLGKFGFYIPGNDQVALSSFTHYGDLNIR